MESADKIREIRLAKIGQIKKLGIDPYPAVSRKKHPVATSRQLLGRNVITAGRIIALRSHGGSAFADIVDETGKIQAFFSNRKLSDIKRQLLGLLDIGDFIEVEGEVGKTQAGEITVFVSDFGLLAKSLRPIPSVWYGLKDVEQRFRKRYLDLLINQEVKNRLVTRARIIKALRQFLDEAGFVEIETPTFQPIYGGAAARPFITHHNALDADFYLKISDELYLKRLIIGGFEKVYEIDKDFRNEGIDKIHNPEFTMLECYQAYGDYHQMMTLTEEIFKYVTETVFGTTKVKFANHTFDFSKKWLRLPMKEAIKHYLRIDVDKLTDEGLKETMKKLKIKYEDKPSLTGVAKGFSRGVAIATIFEACEEFLIEPTFVIDFPKETSALAKLHRANPELIERFEPYIAGWEVGNAYSELNDPILQKEFFERQQQAAQSGDLEAQPMDLDWIEALEYGMPPTGGLGLGVDRMVMILTNTASIREVIAFPTLRPEKSNG